MYSWKYIFLTFTLSFNFVWHGLLYWKKKWGISLAVHWLRLCTSRAGECELLVQSLVWDLRSRMLCNEAKKKKFPETFKAIVSSTVWSSCWRRKVIWHCYRWFANRFLYQVNLDICLITNLIFLIVNSELKSSSGFTWKERPLIRGSWACAFLSPGLSVNLSSSTYYLSEFFCLKILWSIANMSI